MKLVNDMIDPFLSIIGIGEDGITSLSDQARRCLRSASYIFGGKRHLKLANTLIRGQTEIWSSPIQKSINKIKFLKPKSVAILASGDPFWYGIGPLAIQSLSINDWQSFPTLSSYSLACNRLGWTGQTIETISLCGRALETLRPTLIPSRKIFILSENEYTPHIVKTYLKKWQIPYSLFYILEALGGPQEQIRSFSFTDPLPNIINPLNMIALKLNRFEGLPYCHGRKDSFFQHDGQLTKQYIRTATLSALQPYPGALLWDIGTGSGSIAIEWMLTHPSCKAIAIEPRHDRALRAMENAYNMGVPSLKIIEGKAPEALNNLPHPDAVFIGGGLTTPNLLETIWKNLHSYGQLVINSVTTESDQILFQAQHRWGGTINRLQIQRYEPLGAYHGFRPDRTITQYCVTHP